MSYLTGAQNASHFIAGAPQKGGDLRRRFLSLAAKMAALQFLFRHRDAEDAPSFQ
jgi:hypothetical protein